MARLVNARIASQVSATMLCLESPESEGGSLKPATILAVAALTACQQSEPRETRTSGVTKQSDLEVGSKVPDLRIVAATNLPPNPKRSAVDDYCSAYAIAQPKSPGGRLAAQNGWIVTSETKLGTYDAITFVSALDPATSGTCAHVDGNLAVFEGSRLRAIAYERPDPKPDSADLASVDSLGIADQIDPRRIRLHWGLPSAPFADVVLRDGILIEHTARQDQVCGGAAVVPNIFGEDIRQARKKLLAHGWRPAKPSDDLLGGEDVSLRAEGVIEVEACSGTGYGFCAYNYRHGRGFGLRVISAGEEYRVSSYEAYCGGPGQRPAKD